MVLTQICHDETAFTEQLIGIEERWLRLHLGTKMVGQSLISALEYLMDENHLGQKTKQLLKTAHNQTRSRTAATD